LDQSQYPILIEVAFAQIGVSPIAHLELATLLCRIHINAGGPQPPLVFLTQHGIDDMEGLLSAFETFFDERKQQSILLVSTVKEPADMASCAKLRTGEPDWLVALTPRGSPARLALRPLFCCIVAVSSVHIAILLSDDW
jgi:hypothetical protein